MRIQEAVNPRSLNVDPTAEDDLENTRRVLLFYLIGIVRIFLSFILSDPRYFGGKVVERKLIPRAKGF